MRCGRGIVSARIPEEVIDRAWEDLNWFDFGFGDHPRRGILEVGQRISGGSRALPATRTELPGGKTNVGSPGRNVHKN